MNIEIISRQEIKRKKIEDNTIIISINDLDSKPLKFKNAKDVLYLYFDDVEKQIGMCCPMNESDAAKVKDFVECWKDRVDTIIVHCLAGISRSGAIGYFLEHLLNDKPMEEVFANPRHVPNKKCYTLMCEAYGIDITEEYMKKLSAINLKACDEYFANSSHKIVRDINNMFEI